MTNGLGRAPTKVLLSISLIALCLTPMSPASAHVAVEWMSVSETGEPADDDAWGFSHALSGTGRFAAFASFAGNLVPDDPGTHSDVFVRDRKTGAITLISRGVGGTPANGSSQHVSISSNGRLIAFESHASDLVANDTNGDRDVFVHNRRSGITTRVSVTSDGMQTDNHGSFSITPTISSDGRFVVFNSMSPDLVANDEGGYGDTFIHDRETGKTKRISVKPNGTSATGNSGSGVMTANNRLVVYASRATDLIKNDTNGQSDIFVFNRETGKTSRVSVKSNGLESDGDSFGPDVSSKGRRVVFYSRASNLVRNDENGDTLDVFVHDRATGETSLVSRASNGEQGTFGGVEPSISGDGRLVAFASASTNLVKNDTNGDDDIFVRDLASGKTRRVNLRPGGGESQNAFFGAGLPSLSQDGRFVIFTSDSDNIVPADDDEVTDVFVAGPLR
jgi:Tol biopolymer transport system component